MSTVTPGNAAIYLEWDALNSGHVRPRQCRHIHRVSWMSSDSLRFSFSCSVQFCKDQPVKSGEWWNSGRRKTRKILSRLLAVLACIPSEKQESAMLSQVKTEEVTCTFGILCSGTQTRGAALTSDTRLLLCICCVSECSQGSDTISRPCLWPIDSHASHWWAGALVFRKYDLEL